MSHRFLLAAILTITCATAQAGDWLGGQYWGQISGCGHCGGSLYGGGYGGKSVAPCTDCGAQDAPLPMELPLLTSENVEAGVDAIPDPQVPVLRTAYSKPVTGPSSRRTYHDILPIAPGNTTGEVKAVTHVSQPERLTPPTPRLVAPNAWSGRLYR